MKLRFKKWTEEEFFEMREEVLKGWPTGKDVNLEEAVAYHKSLPESKSFSKKLVDAKKAGITLAVAYHKSLPESKSFSKKLVDAKKAGITLAQPRAGVALIDQHIELLSYLDKVGGADLLPTTFSKKLVDAKKAGITLAQPRAGVALIDQHIELLSYLDKVGGADLLPTTIDSYTRQNKYENCERGIEESKKAGRSLLNGFPGVNHGVAGCRKVVEAIDLPLQLRHGTPDARLLSEIMIAAGYTSDEGGGISYNVPYAKSVSLEKTLIDWQYVDRLVGWYEEHGLLTKVEESVITFLMLNQFH